MPKRPKYDWEAIEREYRAGMLSIREIAKQQGCSDTAIRKKAKTSNWARDLSDQVRKRIQSDLVRSKVCTSPVTDEDAIDHAAKRGVEVVRGHRKIIGDTIHLAERLIEASADEGLDPKNHSALFRTIAQGLAKVLPLERQAHNLDATNTGKTIEDQLRELDERTR